MKTGQLKNKDKILLFIPGYNCEKQITRVLDQTNDKVLNYINQIIFINNRSTDNTEQVVLKYKAEHPQKPIKLLRNNANYNLGGSHKVAFQYAINNKFDYIIVLHGDDQGDINDLMPYLEHKEYQKYDCLLGARFMKKSRLEGYSKFRTFGNRVYNIFFSSIVHKKIYDLGSGLNMYNTKILKDNYFIKFPDKLTFNYCMVLADHYYGHKIKFFPISWRENDQASNVKMVSQATKVLAIATKYAFNHKIILSEFRENPVEQYEYKEINN